MLCLLPSESEQAYQSLSPRPKPIGMCEVPRKHLRPVGEAELSLQAKQASSEGLVCRNHGFSMPLRCFEAMAVAAAGPHSSFS